MSLLARLAPHLPYVRRYARALTGDQTSGDNYVRATLEALASGDAELEGSVSPRMALYKVFHVIWHSAGAKLEPRPEGLPGGEPAQRLMRIAPRSRQAFLLTALEGFTPDEAAQILGVDHEAVARLISQAQAEIDAELATEVLITDIAATRTEAVDSARREPPGLVLADIQLADGSSGVDAVKDILAGHDAPVIFITAFPERLLTGERPEPTFLITKPFQPEEVRAAIGQALFFHPRRRAEAA